MKLHAFIIFLTMTALSLFLTSCGGGGGGGGSGGGGGGGVTPSEDQVVGIPDMGAFDQSLPVQNDLESLSYEDLASNFDSATELTPETFPDFLDRYLKKKNLFVTDDDRKSLKEKFFGSGQGTIDRVDIDDIVKNNVSSGSMDQLPNLETIEETTDMAALTEQSTLSDSEVESTSSGLAKVMTALPKPAGSLDKNGDGKVDVRDFMRVVSPEYDPTLSQEQINNAYHYWTYFADIKEDGFKARMWKTNVDTADFPIPPPVMIFSKQLTQAPHRKVVILDFKGHLILKLSSVSDAKELLKKTSYALPFKIEDISRPIYIVSAVERASATDITIDKVIIQHDFKDNKPIFKMTLWIKDNNPLKQGVLVLTNSIWLMFKSSEHGSSLDVKQMLASFFSIPTSWAEGEEKSAMEALDPGFAWKEFDKILKDIGLDIPPEEEAVSSDFSSSNFTPPVPVSVAADIALSRALIEAEHSRIEKAAMKLINDAQACGSSYNSSNECNLDKLLDSLFKLNIRVSEYMKFIYLYLIDARNMYDDLAHSEDNVLNNKKALQKEYDFDMKALMIAQILEFALSAIKSTAQTVMEKIGETYVNKFVEAGMKLGLHKLADLLDLFSNAVAEAGAEKAAIKLKKIAEFARHLTKSENTAALKKGMSLMMSFGVTLMKEYVKEAHKKAARLVDNSLTTLEANKGYQLALIAHYQDFYDLLEEKEESLSTLIKHTESVLNQTLSNRYAAQKACKENHAKSLQELKEQHESDLKDLEDSLEPEEKAVDRAEKAVDQFRQACEHQLFKIELARDSMKTNCIELFNDSGCNKALARIDDAQKVYADKMKCTDQNSLPIQLMKEFSDKLETKKQEIQTQKAMLKQKLNDDISLLDQELEQCRQNSVKGCSSPQLTPAMMPELIEQLKTQKVLDMFVLTRETAESLSVKCATNIVKLFPPSGTFTACQSAYNQRTTFSTQQQTAAFIVLDQPIEYDQIDRSSGCQYWSKAFSDFNYGIGNGLVLSADKRLVWAFTAHDASIWPYEGLSFWYSNGLHHVQNMSCGKSASHSEAVRYAFSRCGNEIKSICDVGSGYFTQEAAFSFPEHATYSGYNQGVAGYQIDVSIYNEAASSTSKRLLAKQTFSVPQGYCDKSYDPSRGLDSTPVPQLVYMSYENQENVDHSNLYALDFFFSNSVSTNGMEVTIKNLDTGVSNRIKVPYYDSESGNRVYVGTPNIFKAASRYQITAHTVKDSRDKDINLNYSVTLSTK